MQRLRRFRAKRVAGECLEQRNLLCSLHLADVIAAPTYVPAAPSANLAMAGAVSSGVTITWTNRGLTNDGFASTFGANANAARAVIDRVLLDWSNAITSFNRADGTNDLQVAISMATSGTGFGANAAPSTVIPADGKPRAGGMTIGRGNDTNSDGVGDGSGWYIDPRPGDSVEFLGTAVNAFAGKPTAAPQNYDFYTVASLELTHVLGLISGTGYSTYKFANSPYLSTLSAPDTAEAGASNTGTKGYFAKFAGPTISHLMTTNTGGATGENWGTPIHTAGKGSTVINGVTWNGSDDSGNAIYEDSRYLPNEVMLRIFADAYGYSIVDPTTLPTVFAQLDASTGKLTVRGLDNSNDTITLTQNGTKLIVSVDIGTDVPGSGALPGAGNLPAYVREFDIVSINSIVVDGLSGNDIITVDAVKPTTVLGGEGSDTLRATSVAFGQSASLRGGLGNDQLYAGRNNNIDDIDGPLTLDGDDSVNFTPTGTDTAWIEDSFNSVASIYSVDGFEISRGGISTIAYLNNENVKLYGGSNNNTYNVFTTYAATSIYGGNGADQFYVKDYNNKLASYYETLLVDGGGGSDTFDASDTAESNPSVYYITGNTLQKSGGPVMTFNNAEIFKLTGTGATDEFRVRSTGSNVTYNIFAGANSDRLYIGDGTSNKRLDPIDGAIFYDGQGGSHDEVSFYDQDNTSANTYTASGASHYAANTALIQLSNTEDVAFYGGSAGDTFNITPSATIEYTLDGRSGTDTLSLNTAGASSPTQNPTSSSSGSWTFGNRLPVNYTSIENNGGTPANNPPSIGSLTASAASVVVNTPITLSANSVTDSDGTVLAVYFYRENNGISGFQSDDFLLSTDTSSPYSANFTPTSTGTFIFYARAVDNGSTFSNVVTVSVNVTAPANNPPTIGSLTSSSSSVIAGSSFRLAANSVVDAENALLDVRFFRETNGTPGLQLGSDTLIATDVSIADGWYTDINTIGFAAGNYQYYALARDAAGQQSNAVTTTVNVVVQNGPVPYYKLMNLEQFPVKVAFFWTADVGTSLDVNDLTVRNLATNQTVGVSEVVWDASNQTGVFSLASFPPDGNYRATLSGSGVSAAGVPMGVNVDVDFYILRGDANHDRKVDFNDLLILAKNYNGFNKNFSQGNFDLDPQGKVDFNDLLLLAKRYNSTLLEAPAARIAAPSRVSQDVLR